MKKKSAGGKPLDGKTVVVGVGGSIAAFKAAEVVSQLVQRGARVPVVMTKSATHFVGPLTFQTITRIRVMVDQFDAESVIDATHISLTEKADLVLVAPATANLIAKIAHGLADDMLTSLLLAVQCPVFIAPAMNDRMWANKAFQKNLAAVRELGCQVIEPEAGFLACGTYAVGRLAEPLEIVKKVEGVLCAS
jgi:phosphopantothenoylcysteine decarboxylase / phosphopantothenate---cysteine ligase